MANIDELSCAELDALAAETVMGWYKGYNGWSWGEHSGGTFIDCSGPSIASWHPSRGKTLNGAANEVLLKALGDFTVVQMCQLEEGSFCTEVISAGSGESWSAVAPTLPLALVRAACKAVAK